MKKTLIRFLPLLTSAMIFAGCGGAAMSNSAMEAYPEEMAESAMDSGSSGSLQEEMGLTANSAGTQPELPEGRKLIRTVHINAETDDFDNLITEVEEKVSELSGYIESSELSGSTYDYRGEPDPRYVSMTIRIPADKLSSFIEKVDSSCNITYKSENTEDVTLQYVDTESRKKSLEVEEERIFALLEKADSIDTIVALESRLSDIRYQLQSLESSLRIFDNQVDYSTIHLSINEVKVFTPVEPESIGTRIQKGFTQNLQGMGEFLVDFVIEIIITSPMWIPLVIIVILIIMVIRFTSRKKKARNKVIENAKNIPLPTEDDKPEK